MKELIVLFATFFTISVYGQTDTLNQIGPNGMKQGYWIITGKMQPEKGFCDTCRIAEWNYRDDRKVEEWIKYYPDGTVRLRGSYSTEKPHSWH